MFESKPTYDAFYLPGPHALPTDESLTLGLRWLLDEPGTPLVVLSAKGNLRNNQLLAQTVRRYVYRWPAPPRIWEAR